SYFRKGCKAIHDIAEVAATKLLPRRYVRRVDSVDSCLSRKHRRSADAMRRAQCLSDLLARRFGYSSSDLSDQLIEIEDCFGAFRRGQNRVAVLAVGDQAVPRRSGAVNRGSFKTRGDAISLACASAILLHPREPRLRIGTVGGGGRAIADRS